MHALSAPPSRPFRRDRLLAHLAALRRRRFRRVDAGADAPGARHENYGDAFRAALTEHLHFHLGPLDHTYRQQYARSDTTDAVIPNVYTAHQPDTAALTRRYRF